MRFVLLNNHTAIYSNYFNAAVMVVREIGYATISRKLFIWDTVESRFYDSSALNCRCRYTENGLGVIWAIPPAHNFDNNRTVSISRILWRISSVARPARNNSFSEKLLPTGIVVVIVNFKQFFSCASSFRFFHEYLKCLIGIASCSWYNYLLHIKNKSWNICCCCLSHTNYHLSLICFICAHNPDGCGTELNNIWMGAEWNSKFFN